MKKHMLFLSLVLLSAHAMAQVESQNIDVDVDSELDQMYQKQPRSANVQYKKSNRNANVVNQTVVVPQTSVQTQPTTFIEASPLSDSKADYIRKNRQDEEMKTETRIVEKLEQSRMEDEKRRAAALFGDKFDSMQNQSPAQPAVQMAPAPQHVQPEILKNAKRYHVMPYAKKFAWHYKMTLLRLLHLLNHVILLVLQESVTIPM